MLSVVTLITVAIWRSNATVEAPNERPNELSVHDNSKSSHKVCKFDTSQRGGIDFYGIAANQAMSGFPIGVEVGAYDGQDASQMVDSGLKVFSFEPSKINYNRCVENYPPKKHKRLQVR